MMRTPTSLWHRLPLLLSAIILLAACERRAQSSAPAAPLPDEPSPPFRNVSTLTAYVGDSACASCHAPQTGAYRQHAMSQTFHQWTAATRVEKPLAAPIVHDATGFAYSIDEAGGQLYQTEFLTGPDGKRLHELKRRMDYVTGSGNVARTYFTAENGRLFQLPLTWYSEHGWDFSPGYRVSNARFDRVMPDRCIACHSSYPKPLPFAEGKYADVRSGIGCERCHGPGALHVAQYCGMPFTSPPEPRGEILCVGELLWDALPAGLFLGGAPFNVACHLRAAGAAVTMVTRVGNDQLGDEARRRVARFGVSTDLLQVDESLPTGFVRVSVADDGNAAYDIFEPAAWDNLETTPMAFCVLLGEGAMADWSALYLRDVTGAAPGAAAAGYAAFSLAMASGRFAGDALTLRFGAMPLVRGGGLLAALGLGLALVAGSSWAAIVGFGAVGAGFSVAFPLMSRPKYVA